LTINIKDNYLITNQRKFILSGSSDPLTRIYVNNLEIFTDNRGQFSHGLSLHEGDNFVTIEAVSKDNRKAVNHSKITLDSIPPILVAKLIIISDKWLINGKTEPNAVVKIGDKTITPNTDGSFEIEILPIADQTEVIISSKDPAGNETLQYLRIEGEEQ